MTDLSFGGGGGQVRKCNQTSTSRKIKSLLGKEGI